MKQDNQTLTVVAIIVAVIILTGGININVENIFKEKPYSLAPPIQDEIVEGDSLLTTCNQLAEAQGYDYGTPFMPVSCDEGEARVGYFIDGVQTLDCCLGNFAEEEAPPEEEGLGVGDSLQPPQMEGGVLDDWNPIGMHDISFDLLDVGSDFELGIFFSRQWDFAPMPEEHREMCLQYGGIVEWMVLDSERPVFGATDPVPIGIGNQVAPVVYNPAIPFEVHVLSHFPPDCPIEYEFTIEPYIHRFI